jgi:hypothetical protein
VIVNVDQSVSLADNSASNAVNSVAQAVYTALQQAAALASGAGNAATGAIESQIGSLTSTLDQGITAAYGTLTNVVQGIETGIGQTLGNIGNIVGQDLFNSINPALIALTGIAATIAQQIGGLGGQIAAAVARIIPVIIAAVTGAMNPLQAALASIVNVLQTGLGGLVQQAGNIATTLGGLGTTLDQVLLHYELWNTQFVESQTGYPDGGTLHRDFSNLAAAIAGLLSGLTGAASVKLSDELPIPCEDSNIQQILNQEFTPPSEPLYALAWPWQAIVKFIGWLIKGLPAMRKALDLGEQALNLKCQSELIPFNELVDAVRRGFIPFDQALTEAEKGNLSPERFQLLNDLATQQISQSQLTEAKYRTIITDSDFQSAMAAQGYTSGQINTLAALAVNRIPVEQLWVLRRRQLIDDPTLKTALAALQYDATQQDALAALSFRPLNVSEAIDGVASQSALGQIGLGGLASEGSVPEYVSVAGQNEGLDAETTALRWASHWNVGSIASYITLYFRKQISLETLTAVMGKNFIPPDLVTTLVEAARPIIQYRTISNMLRIGQLDVQTAGNLLLQHGYSAENAQLLINYAQRPGAAAAAQKAKALHAVSLGIAKREYIDGAISENDYYQILLQHGYTIEGANAEIAVENANQAMLTRKQNAQLVVDEYGAGLIDEKTALAQLAVLGLTVYEIAKYTHKIRAFRVKAAKHPSEAELNDFRKNGIIDNNTYASQLGLIGYSTQVSNWFVQWRTLSTPPPPAAAPAATPAPTGG